VKYKWFTCYIRHCVYNGSHQSGIRQGVQNAGMSDYSQLLHVIEGEKALFRVKGMVSSCRESTVNLSPTLKKATLFWNSCVLCGG